MPVELDNQVSEVVAQVNSYNITSFSVQIDAQQIHIYYFVGTIVGSVFTQLPGKPKLLILSGADFFQVAAMAVNPAKNLYNNLKDVLYSKLLEKLDQTGVVK